MSAEHQQHVVVADGKKFFGYEIRVTGGFLYGWDERPIGVLRKAWLDAWKKHAAVICALSERKTAANIKNFRTVKQVEESSFGSDGDPETAPTPQWFPGLDEMLVLNGIEPLDGKGSLVVFAPKVVGISYRDDKRKATT